ncbi:MAG TPA: hypothetical protein VNW92_23515, partial [Polyangiaceae bacterium]|nr:hypothetical protein [Polyangiaceae bacterium]
VPVPADYLLSCLQSTLPAILNCCEELVVALEGASAERVQFRAAFQSPRPGSPRRASARVFDTLSAAFAHAQRAAPHDVLELQRIVLRQSFPPNGEST